MQPLQHGLESTLRAGGFALVLIRSLAHAYLHIKRVAPDLIVLYLSSHDDAAGCQLLSMLELDRETSRGPIETHKTAPAPYIDEDFSDGDVVTQCQAGCRH